MVVALNRQELANLRYGDPVTLEADPGHHVLRLHSTIVWKRIQVELPTGEHAVFLASPVLATHPLLEPSSYAGDTVL